MAVVMGIDWRIPNDITQKQHASPRQRRRPDRRCVVITGAAMRGRVKRKAWPYSRGDRFCGAILAARRQGRQRSADKSSQAFLYDCDRCETQLHGGYSSPSSRSHRNGSNYPVGREEARTADSVFHGEGRVGGDGTRLPFLPAPSESKRRLERRANET